MIMAFLRAVIVAFLKLVCTARAASKWVRAMTSPIVRVMLRQVAVPENVNRHQFALQRLFYATHFFHHPSTIARQSWWPVVLRLLNLVIAGKANGIEQKRGRH